MHSFYGVVGSPPTVEGAIVGIATVLISRASDAEIQAALNACTTELYPVRLPHILAKLPGGTADVDNEKRLAWGIVEGHVNKWVRWNQERTVGFVEKGAPDLAPRILDSVRRSGGWSVYLRMTDADFPFVQKRFFEEYDAWTGVEAIADRARLLEIPKLKELIEGREHAMTPGTTHPDDIERPEPLSDPSTWSPAKKRIMKAIENLRKKKA